MTERPGSQSDQPREGRPAPSPDSARPPAGAGDQPAPRRADSDGQSQVEAGAGVGGEPIRSPQAAESARGGPAQREALAATGGELAAVTGVHLAQGLGVRPAKGFWADAWSQVLRRPLAVGGLIWLGIVLFFAIMAPFLASGHPVTMTDYDLSGEPVRAWSPMWQNLRSTDLLLPAGALGTLAWWLIPAAPARHRRWLVIVAGVLAGAAGLLVLGAAAAGIGHPPPIEGEAREPARLFGRFPDGIPPENVAMAAGMVGILAWLCVGVATVRAQRWGALFLAALQCGLIVVFGALLQDKLGRPQRELSEWMFSLKLRPNIIWEASLVVGLIFSIIMALTPAAHGALRRVTIFAAAGVVAISALGLTWTRPLQTFDYRERIAAGQAEATFTVIPFSPTQSDTRLYALPPGTSVEQGYAPRQGIALAPREPDDTSPRFFLGTDPLGQDVLSQLLHACRLSISIGLVSTGIAVVIGVTMGALMGYFGGWVDLLLYRVVEVFMAIPVLFLLIVAAGVLPRNTYVMMAIIGCVTWTGAARFTRAEFYKLRNQDFVQSARAVGLPLRAILFRQMLPNGVTPVLVDASFAIAAAILAEATLSYLGLGPDGQASWGKLLSSATGPTGTFVWWIAIFPGLAIFLTVLSYNLIGESLRDAIDPKLKKARV